MKALHAINNHIRSVESYNIYRLLDDSQTYNEDMAARTGKYFKRMKSLKEAYNFDHEDLIATLSF